MAESSSAASTSTSTAGNSNYDVFLNHRGPDVKKKFGSHLYRCLISCGLRVFLDQPELQRGDYFSPQIEAAIQSASVHVAIFSEKYADSIWCLNELVQMLHSKKPIIPVFYHVKPSDLRWTQRKTQGKKRSYAEALEELGKKTDNDPQTHEQRLRYKSSQIEIWRKALSEVSEISGFELEACNGDEGELVDQVVKVVLQKVKKPALDLDVAKYPTGLDDKINDFENTVLLQLQQSWKPQIENTVPLQLQQNQKPQILGIVGIVGLGGVGKTTLTKEFFNRKKSDYSSSCFLSHVRDNAGKDCLLSLQKKLLRSLYVRDMDIERVDAVDEGKVMLRTHLSSANALVILDDVDAVDQVDALLPVLPSNCLILITSRNRDVLISSQIEESSIYNLTGLDREHSLELFCFHAFNQPNPLPRFESLVDKFLKACNGLPLSLQVFGAHLYAKELSDWEVELGSPLPTEIQDILRRSYNSLSREEQQIFLDIACFFIGENKDRAITVWNGSGWQGRRGFQNLRNRCLVEVDSENFIQMHDHLRDVGRDIAEDPGLPCRLWRWTENAINDLLDGPSERAVRGIRMSLRDYNDIDDYDALGDIRMKRLRLLDTEDFLMERILTKVQSPNLIWLRWHKCLYSGLPSSIFLKNLRVLYVEGRKLETLWENESQAPLQLQELKIGGPLSNIPKSIGQLKHLERIEIGPIYGNGSRVPDTTISPGGVRLYRTSDGFSGTVAPFLTKLPEELCLLQSLKALVLKDCKHIKSLPDSLGNLTNLHHIQVSECCTLEKLPDSFCKLIKLQYLDLNSCTNLTMSSKTLGSISTLRYIDLTSCKKIDLLPPQVAQQRSLEELRFGGTNVKELPSAIGELSDLEFVGIGGPLHTLPASLGDLRNLMKLSIWGCKALECLPASLGLLTQLTELWVDGCPLISELPFITEANNGTLPRLRNIVLSGLSISKVSFAEGVCSNLRELQVCHCYYLVEVGTLPNTLTSLEFLYCENLWIIDELYVLAKLQVLVICRSIQLEELPRIETLVSLRYLDVSGCVELKIIQGLGQLTKLIGLSVEGCSELEEVEGIQHCMTLRSFEGAECPKLQWNAEVVEQLRQRCSTWFSINE